MWIWFGVITLAIAFQYIVPSTIGTIDGSIHNFQIPPDDLSSAGIERYLKDALTVLFALVWPLYVGINRKALLYYFWAFMLVSFGSVAYLFHIGYFPFFIAGIRWIVNIHDAFGLYLIAKSQPPSLRTKKNLFRIIIFVLLVSIIYSFYQIWSSGSILNFGRFRAPGVFSQAAVSGFFAATAVFISEFVLSMRARWHRLMIYPSALALAALSGTRFAVACITIFIYGAITEHFRKTGALRSNGTRLAFHAILLPILALFVLGIASALTGRGDIVSDQLNKEGRIGNGLAVADLVIQRGEPVNFLVGMGLGQGTNAAAQMDYPTSKSTKWQLLVDNTLITTFIQLGFVGSIWLFGGIFLFLASRRAGFQLAPGLYFALSLVTQNLPEQIFIVLALGAYVGVRENLWIVNWRRMAIQRRRLPAFRSGFWDVAQGPVIAA